MTGFGTANRRCRAPRIGQEHDGWRCWAGAELCRSRSRPSRSGDVARGKTSARQPRGCAFPRKRRPGRLRAAARPQRQPARRRPAPPPGHPRAAPRRPRTRQSRCQFPGGNSRRTDIHHTTAWANGGKTRLRDLILLCESTSRHRARPRLPDHPHPKRVRLHPPRRPASAQPPALPGSDGDLARCHDADITTDTIVPTGLAGKLGLDLAIWACFANARIDAERASQQEAQAALKPAA